MGFLGGWGGGLIFDPGIFMGFAGSPKEFFWGFDLPPFDYPRHLKSGVPPPSLAIAMTDYNDLVRKNTYR